MANLRLLAFGQPGRAARHRDLITSAGAAPNGPGRCLMYACNTDGAERVSTGFVRSVVGLELASLAWVASGLGSPRSIAKVVESESDYSKGTCPWSLSATLSCCDTHEARSESTGRQEVQLGRGGALPGCCVIWGDRGFELLLNALDLGCRD